MSLFVEQEAAVVGQKTRLQRRLRVVEVVVDRRLYCSQTPLRFLRDHPERGNPERGTDIKFYRALFLRSSTEISESATFAIEVCSRFRRAGVIHHCSILREHVGAWLVKGCDERLSLPATSGNRQDPERYSTEHCEVRRSDNR